MPHLYTGIELTSFASTISSNKEVPSRAMKALTLKLKPVEK